MKLILLFILIASPRAHADVADEALQEYASIRQDVMLGVRSVGNGGGYAEMQAEFINLRMDEWVSGAPPRMKIEVTSVCDTNPITVMTPKRATIASCALYTAATGGKSVRPKDFNDIAKWVLTARSMAQGTNFSDAFKKAAFIFTGFMQIEESIEISLASGNFLFHDLSVKSGTHAAKVLSLEGKDKTQDITTLVQEQIQCSTGFVTSWSTRESVSRSISANRALVATKVSWQCSNAEKWSGLLQIVFETDTAEVQMSSVAVQIFQKARAVR